VPVTSTLTLLVSCGPLASSFLFFSFRARAFTLFNKHTIIQLESPLATMDRKVPVWRSYKARCRRCR
jgi:hypothetical protein